MTTSPTTILVTTGFDEASVLLYLASIYPSPAPALGELLDNGLDAGANRIWVELWPDRIVVTDNGRGMVPGLLPEDEAMLELYREEALAGRLQPGEDIRAVISEISRSSLYWMMKHVAWSPKLPRRGIRGAKGIGALSWRQFADEAYWLTRPDTELARGYWRTDPRPATVPTLKLVPPTRDQLDAKNVNSTIDVVVEDIVAPTGEILERGTQVVLKRIVEGTEFSLRPGILADHFQGRFGEAIRSGRLTLSVVDHVTEEGRSNPSGRWIVVEPPIYSGTVILDVEKRLRGGRYPFRAEIFYNPSGGKRGIQFRRQDNDVGRLADLFEELSGPPFNNGRLEGFIEWPMELSDTEAPFKPDKRTPVEGPYRNQWRQAVEELGRSILEAVHEIEDTERARRVQDYARTVVEATAEAMDAVPEFRGIQLKPPTGRKPRKKGSKPSPQPTAVEIKVLDENNRGVSGVVLELLRGRELVDKTVTGSYGGAMFKSEEGRFRVQIVVPNDTVPIGDTFYIINLTPMRPGIRLVFKLRTGKPAPEKKKLPGFTLWFRAMGDPDELYDSSRLDLGILEINTLAPDMRMALQVNDWPMVNQLTAMYVAVGVTEYCLAGDPHFLHNQAGRLYGKLLNILKERPEAQPLKKQGGRRPKKVK